MLQATISLLLALVSTTPIEATAEVVRDEPPVIEQQIVVPLTIEEKISQAARGAGIDPIIARKIAFCESSLQQFNPDGTLLRGHVNSKDVGLFQINLFYHLADSKKLGYDVMAVDGNIAYAMLLLKRDGTRHWNASRHCWSK